MKKVKTDKILLKNNERKMAGLPLHRKKNKGRRSWTRCEAEETIEAFLDYCNRYVTESNRILLLQSKQSYGRWRTH